MFEEAPTSTNTALSFTDAVAVNNIEDEYHWINRHYPFSSSVCQSVIEKDGKAYDVHEISSFCEDNITLYFDISSFYL